MKLDALKNIAVTDTLKSVFKWTSGIASEPEGNASYSRFSGLFVVVGMMALVWLATLTQKDIPAGAKEIALALIFIVLAGYGVNKYSKVKSITKQTPSPSAGTEAQPEPEQDKKSQSDQ